MAKEKVTKINKDNPWRSVSKAISWRILASGATFLISFLIFKQYTDKSDNEILETASVITSVDVVAKLILYYLHERVWTNITWGKYWERRARRKHIKKMRKAIQDNQ
jgi:uncharacterized membrane protein